MKLLLLLLLTVAYTPVFSAPGDAPWGEPSKGLCARIETSARKVKAGDPITIKYVKANVSTAPLTIWHSGFWPNHRIRVCDAAGELVPRTPQGQLRFKAFSPGGERDKNVDVALKPGAEDVSEPYNITEFFDLTKPGLYSVQYLYEEYQPGWQGQLWSNVLILELVAK